MADLLMKHTALIVSTIMALDEVTALRLKSRTWKTYNAETQIVISVKEKGKEQLIMYTDKIRCDGYK